MKKILSMFTAAFMLFAFASCSGGGNASSGDASTDNTSNKSESSTESTESSSEATNTGAYAPQENGLGNTDLLGIEIKDQNGDGVIHIGCIGDSITAGNPGKCYPDYLQEYLNELSKIDGNTYVVHNNGKGAAAVHHVEEEVGDPNWGWSTVVDEDGDGKAYFYYDDNAYQSAFDYVHDVTIVQMGTNDWGSSDRSYLKDDYYNYLVKPFQDMGSQVIVSTPPYAEEDMYAVINGALHDEVVQMARDLNLPIVDMNRLMYGMDEIYDGIHPFPSGYSVMALIFYEHVFGGAPNTVTVTAQPGTKVTFIDDQGRSYNRNVPETGEVAMVLSPAEVTYSVVAECDGYLTYRETITVKGDMEFKPDQKASENIALMGTPFACDSAVYQGDNGPNDETKINDGDLIAGGYQPASYKEGDYVGVEFDEATAVTNINIYWETAAYISAFENDGFEVEFKINGEWKKQTDDELNVVRNAYTGDIVCDVITLNTPTEIEGVKITFLDGDITDHKYAPKLYELEVFAG